MCRRCLLRDYYWDDASVYLPGLVTILILTVLPILISYKVFSTYQARAQDASGTTSLRGNGILKMETKIWLIFFIFRSTLFSLETDTDLQRNQSICHYVENITVDPNGTIKQLERLNIQKAPWTDDLKARVIKEFMTEIAPQLCF